MISDRTVGAAARVRVPTLIARGEHSTVVTQHHPPRG